jgi:hypothetical protein
VNAARPRYASVLPPPVGKKIRSTASRSWFVRIDLARDVHQQEGELEGAPRRDELPGLHLLGVLLSFTLRLGGGHHGVRELERIERDWVLGQDADAVLDPRLGHPGGVEEGLRRLLPGATERGVEDGLLVDPRPVGRCQLPDLALKRCPVAEARERGHAKLHPVHGGSARPSRPGPRASTTWRSACRRRPRPAS